MFQATVCPSSGETTVFMWHLVLVILYGWLSGMQERMLLHTRQSSIQNNKYQVSHKHSCFSWWWAHSLLKHVEIDKYTKNKLCIKLALFTRLCQKYSWHSNREQHHTQWTYNVILWHLYFKYKLSCLLLYSMHTRCNHDFKISFKTYTSEQLLQEGRHSNQVLCVQRASA